LFIEKFIWSKTNYKLMLGKWKIGIILEAGYHVLKSVVYAFFNANDDLVLNILAKSVRVFEVEEDAVSICDECGSEFIKLSSKMAALCPKCTHVLYGYQNCIHTFKNGRCIYCYWDGSQSEYIKYLNHND
jgi:uncharacterized protein with PIN domain